MTHKKTIILMILCVLLVSAICVSGCISPGQASTPGIPSLTEDRTAWDTNGIFVYVDPVTGVNYLVYSVQIHQGGLGGLCPRYNADGTLYTSEVAS
jgi:hypothetical protein